MIKVLIVDDSPTAREYLAYLINSDGSMKVVGTACDGVEALELAKKERPDVITMDINMPRMNGLEATRRIMEEAPTPIVIVTASWDIRDVQTTFITIEAGALAVLERPKGVGYENHETAAGEFVNTVRLMSEVKVVKRHRRKDHKTASSIAPALSKNEARLVAIGASTGGPMAIRTILSKLPAAFPLPIMVVQHMASGFLKGFVDWLNNDSRLIVSIAVHGELLREGHVYIAPDGYHLGAGPDANIILSKGVPEHNLRPSASYLFRSVASAYGKNAIGIILTGMGRDGARELKTMKERGAVTIAQDKESSVIYGMPGEASALQAATYILPPEDIADMLVELLS
ncbi:MAG TPA: chemotaxis-specific protein-glutamate methyltransferase CheB [Syntrophorhabdaceae bacterium]|nr:chemotaxis-specific protein-glutamate methyltransferase CheB [Syntrophorhabdaceae bacterium]HQM80092.1 chemotaxis-specific protein-glutamate methyltransferase CheB [Syntrophorhabdaceae bacterium]